MPVRTIIDNELASLWYYEEDKIIYHKFKRFIFGEELRAVLDAGWKEMKESGATKWLSDDSENSVLPPDDEEWAKHDWFVRVKAAGWKHWAIVPPKKTVGQMNMERFAEVYAELGINAKFFMDASEALAWLKKQ